MASADISFGLAGSGAGQTSNPNGVATDWSTGNVFVADAGNNRIAVFESDGDFVRAFGFGVANGDVEAQVCTSTCQAGIAGSGAGQLSGPTKIAVDNDPTSPAFHDVYVFDGSSSRVQRFHPNGEFVLAFGSPGPGPGQFESMRGIGVGPGGVVHVVDTKFIEVTPEGNKFSKRVLKFKLSGEFLEQVVLNDGLIGNVVALGIDTVTGNFYVASAGGTGVRKYGPAGGAALVAFNPSFNISALALDPAGNVYVADPTEFSVPGPVLPRAINKYAPTGIQLRAFGYGSLGPSPPGIAFYESPAGEIFASQGSGPSSEIVYFSSAPPTGPIVLPGVEVNFANPIGSVRATLNATINPEGKATTFRFEYVDDVTYEKDVEELGLGHGFDHAKRVPANVAEEPSAGSDFLVHKVNLLVGCLDPQNETEVNEGKCLAPTTHYHFRAVATNADAPAGNPGPEGTFETESAPVFKSRWATSVGLDSAVLHAMINPLGIPTTGRFQYVDEETFQESGFEEASESGSVDFGKGEVEVSKAVQLAKLTPGTTYRYRLLASNFAGDTPDPQVGMFLTFPAPPEGTACPNDEFRPGAAAALADCRAYEMVSPLDKEGGDIVVLGSTPDLGLPAEVAQGAVGGERITYASYRSFQKAPSAPFTVQYMAVREADGWASQSISPPREGASAYSVISLETQYRPFSEDLCSGWLLADSAPLLAPGAVPDFGNLYRRESCDEEGYEAITTVAPPSQPSKSYVPEVQGFSLDNTRTVFRANDKLTPEASEAAPGGKPIFQVYGSQEGALSLISVLPGGEASGVDSSAGSGSQSNGSGFRHDSLTHAVSDDGSRVFWTAGSGPGKIYLRENPFAGGEECVSPASPCTLPVSESVGGAGSTSPAQFWMAAADGSKAIFSFTGGSLAGNLYEYEVTTETPQLIAGKVEGVVGASEDATRVYLVSNEVLAPGAEAGKSNLYLYRSDGVPTFTFIATLSGLLSGSCSLSAADPSLRCARVAPDGETLALMSNTPLTTYDNADAVSGEPDAEVFLYNAEEAELRCISCNPSLSRPAGRGVQIFGKVAWIAGKLPTAKTSFHVPRVLSTDGSRLFFESYDPLLPRDTNGRRDVYEWEAAAAEEECEEMGAELYVPAAAGCISLISSGQSEGDSEFVDASASGDDVFFKTAESLLPQDSGLIDIYDARVGGGFAPPPVEPPPCEGEACQPAPPPPPVLSPSSLNYVGPGNERASTTKPKSRCPKGKHKQSKNGKTRCVKDKAKRAKRASKQRRTAR